MSVANIQGTETEADKAALAAAAAEEAAKEAENENEEIDDEGEGESALADAGKQALDRMKVARNAAREDAREAKAELEKLRAAAAAKDLPAEQAALDAARREGASEATNALNTRLVKSELKAAAKGKLADPSDAHLYIDLKELSVDANGDVDSDALDEAIDDLIARKPHLAAAPVRRFDATADQGAKGKETKVTQLTESQYTALPAAERAKARADGRINNLMGISA
ncbi:hypothetical protein [Subtercola sp. RTI3]|uniref:hypothetical protein n=1 Tax=Subtercola sp. RTI3 TaxID=3048639 RepID=UPI002B2298D3|nr:hypothetical protein [Subtercola sp. RTI3]MEA9983655.1 hypothetical protein [Subtercola sp. RTI3]